MATKTGVYPVYENQFQVGASKEARTIDFIVLESDQNGNQKPQSEI